MRVIFPPNYSHWSWSLVSVGHLVRSGEMIPLDTAGVSLCLSWDSLGGGRAPARIICQCHALYSWYFISHRREEGEGDSHNPPGTPQWKHSWYHSPVCSVILSVKTRHHTTSHHITHFHSQPQHSALICWPTVLLDMYCSTLLSRVSVYVGRREEGGMGWDATPLRKWDMQTIPAQQTVNYCSPIFQWFSSFLLFVQIIWRRQNKWSEKVNLQRTGDVQNTGGICLLQLAVLCCVFTSWL